MTSKIKEALKTRKTQSYNGGYEDDFARLQETSRELLKKLENSGTTYRKLDEEVRERYTRGIQEKFGREIDSNPNVHESSLKSQSKNVFSKEINKEYKIVTKPDGTIYKVYDIQDNAQAKKKSGLSPVGAPFWRSIL